MADGSHQPARALRHMDHIFLGLANGPATLPDLLPTTPPVTRFVCAWRMEQAGLPQASAILRFGENAEGFTLDATRLRNVLFQRAE